MKKGGRLISDEIRQMLPEQGRGTLAVALAHCHT